MNTLKKLLNKKADIEYKLENCSSDEAYDLEIELEEVENEIEYEELFNEVTFEYDEIEDHVKGLMQWD